MIGIYKITNLTNNHCYIGQSRNILKRWYDHKIASQNKNDKGYDYPLYRAFRKYGIENFSFEIIEECSIEELNDKEIYWIKYYNPTYNQTIGGDFNIVPQKLTYEQVQEIQQIFLADKEGNITYSELAEKYNVHRDTIRNINLGISWFSEELSYPLRIYKYDERKRGFAKEIFYCECGKEKTRSATLCKDCYLKSIKSEMISREQLKEKIRNTPFTTIGKEYGVSDNAVRKWCDRYSLPRTKKEINSYSDEEWDLI